MADRPNGGIRMDDAYRAFLGGSDEELLAREEDSGGDFRVDPLSREGARENPLQGKNGTLGSGFLAKEVPPSLSHEGEEEETGEEEGAEEDFSLKPRLPKVPFVKTSTKGKASPSEGVSSPSRGQPPSGGVVDRTPSKRSGGPNGVSEEGASLPESKYIPPVWTEYALTGKGIKPLLPQPKRKAPQVVVEEPKEEASQGEASDSPTSPPPVYLGLTSFRTERDTVYAIAFVNPYIRRLLKHYKDDPFWSKFSRQIIEICLMDSEDSWLDPRAVLAQVRDMSDGERARAERSGFGYLKAQTPADAAVVAKVILHRMRTARLHSFLREYDASPKETEDVERLIANITFLSRHYGMALGYKSLLDISLNTSEESERPVVLPSFFRPLNYVLGYGGYLMGQLVLVAAAPARGKTTFLLNEALNLASNGARVLYFALADMTEEDLILKSLSILTGWKGGGGIFGRSGDGGLEHELLQYYDYLYSGKIDQYSGSVGQITPARIMSLGVHSYLNDPANREVLSRIKVVVDSESRPHVEDIHSTVMSLEEDPDVIIVDYDRSVKARTAEGLYQEGEEIYEGLVSLAKPADGRKRLVLVASQIHKSYWSKAEVPLEAVAESSRKQAIADVVITIGRDMSLSPLHVGYISLVKNRRGPVGSFPYILLPSNNIFALADSGLLSQSSGKGKRPSGRSRDGDEE